MNTMHASPCQSEISVIPQTDVNGVFHPEMEKSFKLVTPFTMIMAGPSGCGKSSLVKKLLQQNETLFNGPPQRIVWLYKRWQPMYDVIKTTVYPPVEFIEGIPPGIDQSSFFDSKVRNLLIVDDLMSKCGDDPRMTEIFYEGSHHRNLNVILICQNLYHSKTPTQRRNANYLVLFKNPNDQQSVMTFARQINPRRSKEFLEAYDTATAKPHSYLLIDFKQNTEEKDRLRPNVFDKKEVDTLQNDEAINSEAPDNHYQSQVSYRAEHIEREEEALPERSHLQDEYQRDYIEEKMVSCDYCGIVMDNIHDLQRHLTTWCPMKMHATHSHAPVAIPQPSRPLTMPENDVKRKIDINAPEPKRFKCDEHKCFAPIRAEISHAWAKTIKHRQKEYEEEGYSKESAKAKTINENIKEIRKDLRESYANYIKNWMELSENSTIHGKVMTKTRELHEKESLNWIDAARLAVKEYKPLVDMNALPERSEGSEEDNDTEIDETTDSENE